MDPIGMKSWLEERKRARAERRANRAREALFVKVQDVRGHTPEWNERSVRRRITLMTDKQVSAALAMSEDEIKDTTHPTAREPKYAPGTNEGGEPTRLWSHPTDWTF